MQARNSNQWQERLRSVAQDTFDLMANERIKVVIEGAVGNVDGVLYVWQRGEWHDMASVIAAETWEDAMGELLDEARVEMAVQ